jgi:phage FluMu protein Com
VASLPPTRSTALASPLQAFAEWHLTVNCPSCRVLRKIEIGKLIDSSGGSAIIGIVIRRLRCQSCGSAPDWVQLSDGEKYRGRKVREVMLVQDQR